MRIFQLLFDSKVVYQSSGDGAVFLCRVLSELMSQSCDPTVGKYQTIPASQFDITASKSRLWCPRLQQQMREHSSCWAVVFLIAIKITSKPHKISQCDYN